MSKRIIKGFSDLNDEEYSMLEEIYYKKFQDVEKGVDSPPYKELFDNIVELLETDMNVYVDCDESALRKAFKNFYIRDTMNVSLDEELVKKQILLNKETVKLRDQANETRKLIRQIARTEFWMDSLIEALKHVTLTPITSTNTHSNVEPTKNIIISDSHIGGMTREEHQELFNKLVVDILNNTQEHEVINITCLGDMIDGMLRLGDIKEQKIETHLQVFVFVEIFLNLIESLIQNNRLVKTIYYIDRDNHGEIRHIGSQRNELPNDNYNNFIVALLKEKLKESGIELIHGESFDIGEYQLFHGHQYSNLNAVKKEFNKISKRKALLGHYHDYYNDSYVVVAPALVHPNRYAKGLGHHYARPGYLIMSGESVHNRWL